MSEPRVDIKIEAHVQVGELRKMEEALQREIVRMRALGAETDKLKEKEAALLAIRGKLAASGRGEKIRAAAHEVGASIPGVGPLLTALNGTALGVGAAVSGIATAFRMAGDAIRAFAASEVEMAKLDAALANSGKLTDDYREKLSKLATERSGKTGIDDEKYVGVFTTLTKFGADSSNIESYTTAVENLAGFMGGDLEQAAFLFGKAMQGSTEMLGRYGISVDKSKSQTEQLADILRQLEARGGGQLEAMGATLPGSFNKVSNAWENLLESMGSAAEKSGLARALADWANGVQVIADKLGGGAPSKAKNREGELVGNSAGDQEEADRITARRHEIDAIYGDLFRSRMAAKKDKASFWTGGKKKAELKKLIDWQTQEMAKLDEESWGLTKKEMDLKLRRVTPEEAGKIRESQARKAGTVEFFPGGSPEDIAKAKEYAEAARLKKEALTLSRAELEMNLKIANAAVDGNEKERLRLQWIKEYNAARREAKQAGMGENEAVVYASEKANAGSAGRGYKLPPDAGDLARKAVGVSSAARLGMAVGESSGAAPVVDAIRELITKQRASDDIAKRTATATETLAKQRRGYQ